jgi:hypothetical protein
VNQKQTRVIAAAVALAVAIVVVAVIATAQKRPPSCDPALRAQADALAKSGLAIASTAKAAGETDAVLEHADAVDKRFFILRRYDIIACDQAKADVEAAQKAVDAAQKAKPSIDAVVAVRRAKLAALQQQIDAALAWVATGLVGDDIVGEVRAAKDKLDERTGKLDRAYGQLTASGYEGDDAKKAVGIGFDEGNLDFAPLREKAAGAVLAKCKLASAQYERVRAQETWLVASGGDGGAAIASIERDQSGATQNVSCTPIVRSLPKGTAAAPGQDPAEKLFTWTIPGALVTTTMLVGWSPRYVWFVGKDVAFRFFNHHAPAGCTPECAEPNRTDKALEAKCTCGGETFEARYAFDGHAVQFEP